MTTSASADGAEDLGSFEPADEVSEISGQPGTSDASGPRTRRWAKTDATQQRILDAATEVFGERGFSAATMGDIAARSGASIGSIYHHFGGKNELFLAIYERQSSDIDRRIEEVARSVDGSPSFDQFARAYLTRLAASRHILTATRQPDGQLRDCSRSSARPLASTQLPLVPSSWAT